MVQYDKTNQTIVQYYQNKIGKTAKEFLKGTYDASTGQLRLNGYEKHDPDSIIGLDIYELKVDDLDNIGGQTNTNDSWLGRINRNSTRINNL